MASRKSALLASADAIGFFLALLCSGLMARHISEIWFGRDYIGLDSPDTQQQIAMFAALAAAGIAFFAQKGHYAARTPWWQQVGNVISFCAFAFLIEGFINYVLKTPVTRLWVGLSWALAVPFILSLRWLARAVLKKLGVWEIPTIVIGGAESALEILYALKSEAFLSYKILYVALPDADALARARFGEIHADMDIKGGLEELRAGDLVVLCPDQGQPMPLKSLIEDIDKARARFVLAPSLEGFSMYGMQPGFFFGYDAVLLHPRLRLKTFPGRFAKRAIDVTGAALASLFLAPLFLIVGRKIKKDGGPVFYAQTRIGRNGRPFKCWKFRSMAVDAEERLKELLAADPAARAEWEKDFKLKNDPRITKIGEFLRRTSLDEIPQIYNVLRGEMSLVGPRPIVQDEIKYYGDKADDYISVRPGITGLWQVSGRNDITYAQRVYLDSWYVRHWSVWNDIVIIIKTIFVVLARRGAY